jgi:hypothetical protein
MISYRSMHLSTWVILLGSVCTTFFVAFTKVREHSSDEVRVLVGEGTGMGPGAVGVDDADLDGKKGEAVVGRARWARVLEVAVHARHRCPESERNREVGCFSDRSSSNNQLFDFRIWTLSHDIECGK